MHRIIPAILILFYFSSCSKNSGNDNDTQPPVIDLFQPADQQGFTGNQNILISGHVSDNKYIKEIHIEITNLVTAQEYLHVHIHPDAATYNFNQNFAVQQGISYQVRIIADDASSNSTAKKVEIACH